MVYCDNCGSKVADDSRFCPNCGREIFMSGVNSPSQPSYQQPAYQHPAYQQPTYQQQIPPVVTPVVLYRPKDGALAAILSFLIPGLGQMYLGNVSRGIAIFIAFCCTIWFLVGIIIWFWGIFDANQQAKVYNASLATSGRPPW